MQYNELWPIHMLDKYNGYHSVQYDHYFEKLSVFIDIFDVLSPTEAERAIQTVQKEGIPLIRR